MSRRPVRAGTTISLLNMKGGVGKTTLAVNIAWHLCRFGRKRVLLVDLDPQFNASQYIMSPGTWDKHRINPGTVADLLLEPHRPKMTARKKKGVRPSLTNFLYRVEGTERSVGCLDLLPSDLTLATAIKAPQGVAQKLDKALGRVLKSYDYIIIDCAPTDSILTDTALMASDYVLIPMRPDRFSVVGYALMQESMDTIRDTYHDPHNTQVLGVVFTQVSRTTDSVERDCMDEIEDQAEYVFEAHIPRSDSYGKSAQIRKPVFGTSWARDKTKRALRDVVHEMKARIDELDQG